MIAGILITFREGLEAFLIIGILLGYLRKAGHPACSRYVWAGTVAGVLSSIGLAWGFQTLAMEFEGPRAAWFEAVASAIAVPILSYMVLYMQRHARGLKTHTEARAALAVTTGQVVTLATLAFITVLREGLETAIFLTALMTRVSSEGLMPGAFLGLVASAVIAYAIFASTVRLDLRRFFIVTSVLLIFIAAGLCAHIFMALHEIGLHLLGMTAWSTKSILDSDSLIGRLLHAFMGYHDEPTVIEVLVYFGYLGIMGWAFMRAVKASAPPKSAPPNDARSPMVIHPEDSKELV
ncbi:MAG: iron permease [Candidatus Methylomirabilota bacterium]|nr:MAG: iron permease [candidate division NC10 bacterium]